MLVFVKLVDQYIAVHYILTTCMFLTISIITFKSPRLPIWNKTVSNIYNPYSSDLISVHRSFSTWNMFLLHLDNSYSLPTTLPPCIHSGAEVLIFLLLPLYPLHLYSVPLIILSCICIQNHLPS